MKNRGYLAGCEHGTDRSWQGEEQVQRPRGRREQGDRQSRREDPGLQHYQGLVGTLDAILVPSAELGQRNAE